LLKIEENNDEMLLAIHGKRNSQDQLVAIIVTIGILCEAHPPFSMKHLSTLLPYLKGDLGLNSQQEALVCLKVCEIVTAATMVDSIHIGVNKANELSKDLTNIALKYAGPNITAAVNCLAHLAAHITHNATHLILLAEKCFSAIAIIAKTVPSPGPASSRPVTPVPGPLGPVTSPIGSLSTSLTISPQQAARVQRCLVVLGTYIYVNTYIYTCIYVYIYMYIYLRLYM
jgi:hypothetical protein